WSRGLPSSSPTESEPVKLAHLADLHLGFRQYDRQTARGGNQREVDVADAFRRAVDDLVAQRPDLILLAGDIFHSVRPTNPAILFLFRELQPVRRDATTRNVLLVHGEVEGVIGGDRSAAEYGGALLTTQDLAPAQWDYVALGHYHVCHEVAANAWYSGSLEHVSPNAWGELKDEAEHGRPGKGYLLVDLPGARTTFRPIRGSRRLVDLPPIQG